MARPSTRPTDSNLVGNHPNRFSEVVSKSAYLYQILEKLGVSEHHWRCKGKTMYFSRPQAEEICAILKMDIGFVFPSGFYDHTLYPDVLDKDPIYILMDDITYALGLQPIATKKPKEFRDYCLRFVDDVDFYKACMTTNQSRMTHNQYRQRQTSDYVDNYVLHHILYLGLNPNKISEALGKGKRYRSAFSQYQILTFEDALQYYVALRKQSPVSMSLLFPNGVSVQPKFDFSQQIGNVCTYIGYSSNPTKHYVCSKAEKTPKNWMEIFDLGYTAHLPVVEALESYARVQGVSLDLIKEAVS